MSAKAANPRRRSSARARPQLVAALGLALLGALAGCQTRPTTVELYPEDDAAPRQVMDLMFMQRLTLPDNFVLRPD
ncbi:MAG: hypothetical protein KC468_18230, partial [Myxococcales bacterium]|nr:hypothetical protein [Myxococcales bacterium]